MKRKKEIKTTDWLTKGMTEEQIQKIKEDAIADFDRVTNERYDIAKIIADNFHINGEKMDDSDFEWAAHCLQMAGYRKQKEGKWIYENTGYCLDGTDAPLDYKCSLCREFATDMFDYCPNCGAKMKGCE